MKQTSFQEQVFFTTVRIVSSNANRNGSSIGTGFVVFVSNAQDKNGYLLLVSNKHVFIDKTHQIELVFTKRDETNRDLPAVGNLHIVQAALQHPNYIEHPDPAVDLACFNISAVTRPDINAYVRNLNPNMFLNDDDDISAGQEVWFVGYPENRYDVAHNLPIVRRGYIASAPSLDFNGKRQIVIDAQVHPGSSGSPVFATTNNQYKLIGVVTETMIKHSKLQSIPAANSLGVEQVLGLGIVLKVALVKELLESAQLVLQSASTSSKPPRATSQAEPGQNGGE